MGKDHDKPGGRRTAYAFFIQACREDYKQTHPNENVNFKEFSKQCGDRWRLMSDSEKVRFQEMADKDKVRYDREMMHYTPPTGEPEGRGRKRKAPTKKDPNAPKRSLSAFFWFCQEFRPEVRKNLPSASVGDVAKELGKLWAKVTPEEKRRYEQLAEQDKVRYEKDLAFYKKHGRKQGEDEEDNDENDGEEEEDDE